MNLRKTQVEPWLDEILRGVKILQCPNWTNFMSILHLSMTRTRWRSQFPDLSSQFAEDLEEGIFEESRGNLKDSLSPRFPLSQNSEIWQSILHHSMPQIWWCVHIFHLIILFFSHFLKWSVGVSVQHASNDSMRFNAVWLMGWTASAIWHLFLHMAPGCEVYAVCLRTSFCYASCCTDPCLMFDVRICFLLVSWFLLDVMQNHLCDVLVVMIHHVCLNWDPFYAM